MLQHDPEPPQGDLSGQYVLDRVTTRIRLKQRGLGGFRVVPNQFNYRPERCFPTFSVFS